MDRIHYNPPEEQYNEFGDIDNLTDIKTYNIEWFIQDIEQAYRDAKEYGIIFRQCSMIHYQMIWEKHLWNLYPTKFRIWGKGNPFLEVERPWTALDVVESLINYIILHVAEEVRQELKNNG